MNLADLTLKDFIDEVSASSPAPGGGSVSALAAALAAALVSMVGSLTLRKLPAAPVPPPQSEGRTCPEAAVEQADWGRSAGTRTPDEAQPDVEADMTMAVDIASDLRRHFAKLIDDDAAAFNAVMGAYRLPKSTDEERKARSASIQAALKEACRVPSEVAKGSVEVLRLSDLAAREGVQSALSDAAVACLAADAALHGAYLNVMINLESIKDPDFVATMREEMSRALESGEAIREGVMARVREALA